MTARQCEACRTAGANALAEAAESGDLAWVSNADAIRTWLRDRAARIEREAL